MGHQQEGNDVAANQFALLLEQLQIAFVVQQLLDETLLEARNLQFYEKQVFLISIKHVEPA
jgi:hypothetical protein